MRKDERERESLKRRKRNLGLEWKWTGLHVFIRAWTRPVHLNQSGSPPDRSLFRFSPLDSSSDDVDGVDVMLLWSWCALLCALRPWPLDLGFLRSWINPTPLRLLEDPRSIKSFGPGSLFTGFRLFLHFLAVCTTLHAFYTSCMSKFRTKIPNEFLWVLGIFFSVFMIFLHDKIWQKK
jgi:hypothetical protein